MCIRDSHEAYGVESYAYGRYPMAPTKYSKIIHFTTVPDMDNEDTMLRILHDFAAQHKGKRLYLFGCTDDYAAMTVSYTHLRFVPVRRRRFQLYHGLPDARRDVFRRLCQPRRHA